MATKPRYIIHVNRQFIGINARLGEPVLPTYIIREGNKPSVYVHSVKINGPSEMVDPRVNSQLKCGARAWMQTDGPLDYEGGMSFQEAKELQRSVENANSAS